jgi:hypothetical protein
MHGQDAAPRLGGIWQPDAPAGSLITLAKEAGKLCTAALGGSKYGMHRGNSLLTEVTLRDSNRTLEFMRTNPHPLGVSAGDNATGLARVLSDKFLDRLVERRAKAIVYTHLGKQIDQQNGFPAETRRALEKLASRVDAKQVLVATTQRVLDYSRLLSRLSWTVRRAGDVNEIILDTNGCSASCDGLSFIVAADREYRVLKDGSPLEAGRTKLKNTEKAVVYVPWRRLDYGVM